MTCGYALTGLPADGSCPECGTPVARSLRGDGWEQAPAAWVARLRRGALNLRRSFRWAPFLIYPWVALSLVGVWRLTARRPDDDQRWLSWRQRQMARWVTMFGGILTLVLVGAAIVGTGLELFRTGTRRSLLRFNSVGNSWIGDQAIDALLIAGHSAYAIGLLLLLDYMRKLGRRVPDGVLVAVTEKIGYRTALAIALVAMLGLLAQGAERLDGLRTFQGMIVPATILVGGFCVVAFGLICIWWWLGLMRWSTVLVERMRPRH